MSEKENLDKVMDKIKKLLLKADSTDSPQEAEALFVKANKMMIRYKISQANIDSLNNDPSEILTNEVKFGLVSLEGKWEIELMSAICRHQGCKFVWGTRTKIFTIYGSQTDTELVKYFFEGARRIFRQVSRKAYNEEKARVLTDEAPMLDELSYYLKTTKMKIKYLEKQGLLSYRSVYVRSFLYGASNGLAMKLRSMVRETISEEVNGQQYGLILTNQLERIENHIQKHVKPKTQNSQGAFGDAGAMAKGRETGASHNLTLGVESSATSTVGNKKLN